MAKHTLTTNNGKTLILYDKNEINRGGEGRIISIDNNKDVVAKIYHKIDKAISIDKFNSLTILDKTVFVVPEELLYRDKLNVGFTMQYIGKDYFPLSTFFGKNFCIKNNIYNDVKKNAAKNIAKAITNAHSHGITIGDLNQYNILVNLKGDIKIIDTDSFATSSEPHSGVLLDEIRDYLYNGIVNQNSDFFAFSVLVFYMLTYTHPFKGIHKKYKKISDRMIHKIPIFLNDPDLKVPKCYSNIADLDLMKMFENLYLKGDRFLLMLDNLNLKQAPIATVSISNTITEKNIIITPVINNVKVIDVKFNQEQGYIKTEKEIIIYSARNRTYLSRKHVIKSNDFENIFIGNSNILLRKNTQLYHYKNENNITEIKNFKIEKDSIFVQKENILIIIKGDIMFRIFIDEIINNSVKLEREEIFGKGFSTATGLVQNSGGVKRIFYNTGKNISSQKIDKNIKALIQYENVGLVQFIDNEVVENRYFKISGNNLELSVNKKEAFTGFAFMPGERGDGFILEPVDDAIKFIRTQDFNEVSKIECSYINEHTNLFYSKSGIIAQEENSVFLINKKV